MRRADRSRLNRRIRLATVPAPDRQTRRATPRRGFAIPQEELMKRTLLALALLLLPAVALADDLDKYIELMRSDLRTGKTAVMTEYMKLSDADGAKFWPLQREYETELAKIEDQRIAMIKDYAANYASLTDQKASDEDGLQALEPARGAAQEILGQDREDRVAEGGRAFRAGRGLHAGARGRQGAGRSADHAVTREPIERGGCT